MKKWTVYFCAAPSGTVRRVVWKQTRTKIGAIINKSLSGGYACCGAWFEIERNA